MDGPQKARKAETNADPVAPIDPSPEDIRALNEVAESLHKKLKVVAAKLRWPGANASLHATSLVNEAYLKLTKSRGLALKPPEEIFANFAQAMRQILIDAARRRQAQKRGNGAAVPLHLADFPGGEPAGKVAEIAPEDVLTLETSVRELHQQDARQALIIDCRFYLGMTLDEVAKLMGISKKTVEREEKKAREFLSNKIRQNSGAGLQ